MSCGDRVGEARDELDVLDPVLWDDEEDRCDDEVCAARHRVDHRGGGNERDDRVLLQESGGGEGHGEDHHV